MAGTSNILKLGEMLVLSCHPGPTEAEFLVAGLRKFQQTLQISLSVLRLISTRTRTMLSSYHTPVLVNGVNVIETQLFTTTVLASVDTKA